MVKLFIKKLEVISERESEGAREELETKPIGQRKEARLTCPDQCDVSNTPKSKPLAPSARSPGGKKNTKV